MPELPEVETIRRVIEPQIRNLTIKEVQVRRPEVIAHPGAEEFCVHLTGQAISSMGRRGKFLTFNMENGDQVILHLRMTGCLLAAPPDMEEEKHTHVVFSLSSGKQLRFSDTRRFGRFWLIKKGEHDSYSGVENLGPEPFDPRFTAEYLKSRLAGRRKAIKECLLDQSVVAGIGNIYSDEILFSANIHPSCPANRLSSEDWQRLGTAVPERLSYFIGKDELTPEEYLEGKGKDYRNGPFLQVYGRQGKPCPVCGQPLCRSVIGGRGSIFCEGCQKVRK